MKTIYKVILVNLSSLTAFIIVLFTIPASTNLMLYGLVCLGTLVVMNAAIFVLPRFRKRDPQKSSSKSDAVKVIVLVVILILGLVWNWMQWHSH